jgi:hypothetical protein
MKKLNALIMLSIGVLASSSGMIQTQAAFFDYFVDYTTKTVANFNSFNQTFNPDTYNLNNSFNFKFSAQTKFSACPTNFTVNTFLQATYRANGTGSYTVLTQQLPDIICSTTFQSYVIERTFSVSNTIRNLIVNDDANFIEFLPYIGIVAPAASNGLTFQMKDADMEYTISYDFGTTYLFNYFLTDTQFTGTYGGGWSSPGGNTLLRNIEYVFTTAGNDTYRVFNNNFIDLGTTRTKYAIDVNGDFFRGESVGVNYDYFRLGILERVFATGGFYDYGFTGRLYFLNTANLAQAIVNVPQISFTSQTCSGGFLDINVGCYVNNALAYLTNTAPVISDLTTIVNTGIQFAGQTFGVIGNFTTSNMFGYLILGGFGFIAVKWLFKDDK